MCAEFINLTNDIHIIITPDYSMGYTQSFTTINNPIMELLSWFFNIILIGFDNIFDFISIFFLLNFWFFSFLIFVQGWELLVNYTSYFNTKNTSCNSTKIVGIISNKLMTNNKNLIKYYV